MELDARLAIERLFPEDKIPCHYLTRGIEVFACVGEIWWSVKASWEESLFEDHWETVLRDIVLEEVDPPYHVCYVTSVKCWDGGGFSPEIKDAVLEVMWSNEHILRSL